MKTDVFYITNIKVNSLFGTKNINWDVFPTVNILGGTNGSGKSTIIKAVYTILKGGFIYDTKLARLISRIVITCIRYSSTAHREMEKSISAIFLKAQSLII